MKILNLSLDSSIADPTSRAAERARWYGELESVERYVVLVPRKSAGSRADRTELSPKVSVISVSGENKFQVLRRMLGQAHALFEEAQQAGGDGNFGDAGFDGGFDLITVQDPYFLGMIAVRLARQYRCALEVQVHGLEKFTGVRKYIAGRVLRSADGIRTVSQRMKNFLKEHFSVPDEKITVVPVFAEISFANVDAVKHSLPAKQKKQDTFTFLTLSRLVPVKHISLQIEALARVLKGGANNAELWIVGDGPEKSRLERIAKEFDVEDRVKLWGNGSWRPDDANNLSYFYSVADTFLLTSDNEGWGMVVIEAAAHGLPSIMTDVGCARELIVDDVSGIILSKDSILDALIAAMRRIMDDAVLRKRLADNARQVVQNLPSKEATLALYQDAWQNARNIKNARSAKNVAQVK